ncbi:MAG: collagen-like protein [Gaiellaceae bacterium]
MSYFRKFLHEHRPSSAMVVASIALLVALSGTSIAAVANVPLLSVGTPQLKSNAVISAKVKNRSLLAVDFKQGQLPRGPRGAQGPAGPSGPSGPQGPAGVAAPGYVAAVSSQTSGTAVSTTSTAFVDLAGSSETFTVPTGETARIYAIFSAETACYNGGLNRSCGVRIVVDGNELNPAVGTNFAFDSSDDGDEGSSSQESHAIARSSETLSAGSHTVKVQIRSSNVATTFTVDDWALIVYRTKLS